MVTISLSQDANMHLKGLTEHFGFDKEKDMALFAFAYAITEKIPIEKTLSNIKTKWGTSTFEDVEFDKIIEIFYPNENITNTIELVRGLMNAGIYKINSLVNNNPDLTISELLPK